MFKYNAEKKSYGDPIQAKKRKYIDEEVTLVDKESNLVPPPIDLSVSLGDENAGSKQGEVEFKLREAKLATWRLAQKQAAVAAANSAIISNLENHFLDAIGGRIVITETESPLPFQKFLDKLQKTEPQDLRLYSISNDLRVDCLYKLHKFAYRIHTTGFIGSKTWVARYYKRHIEPKEKEKEDKSDEE